MSDEPKPISSRGQATIDKILNATIEFVQREGATRLTTNHIAKESGVKVGSIYHFFPNKEAILLELVRRWQAGIQAVTYAYLEQSDKDTPFAELIFGIVILNLGSEYEYSKAFDDITLATLSNPDLASDYRSHLNVMASMIADHYMQSSGRVKGVKKKQVVEFSLFLHPMVTEGMAIVADKKGKVRERHLKWFKSLIEGAVASFETSVKNA